RRPSPTRRSSRWSAWSSAPASPPAWPSCGRSAWSRADRPPRAPAASVMGGARCADAGGPVRGGARGRPAAGRAGGGRAGRARRGLRVGAFPRALATTLLAAVARLVAREPELEVRLREGRLDELAAGVRTGDLHAALCFQDAAAPRREHGGTRRHELVEETM